MLPAYTGQDKEHVLISPGQTEVVLSGLVWQALFSCLGVGEVLILVTDVYPRALLLLESNRLQENRCKMEASSELLLCFIVNPLGTWRTK